VLDLGEDRASDVPQLEVACEMVDLRDDQNHRDHGEHDSHRHRDRTSGSGGFTVEDLTQPVTEEGSHDTREDWLLASCRLTTVSEKTSPTVIIAPATVASLPHSGHRTQ
jgi:hypothetical protein